jgi:hypothetical protein
MFSRAGQHRPTLLKLNTIILNTSEKSVIDG